MRQSGDMRIKLRVGVGVVVAGACVLWAAGCGGPPTAFERHFFNITTNFPSGLESTNQSPGLAPAGYTFEPNETAKGVARSLGSFGPVGELASVALGGVFGLWGLLRSNRATRTAGVLVQVIETGRELMARTPQGAAAGEAWKQWMVMHQAETGVIREVVDILNKAVDEKSAGFVAQELVERMAKK